MKAALSILIPSLFIPIFAEDICGYPKEATVEITSATGGKKLFSVGIAETDAEHEKGLMFCEKLGKDQGLFFVFNVEEPHFFWMKNTPVELAVIYVSRDFKVVSVRRGTPFSTATLPSIYPSMFVLEVNWKEGASVMPGDKVKMKML